MRFRFGAGAVLFLTTMLGGCSGGFPGLSMDSFFGEKETAQSAVVDSFSQTCLANPKSFGGIRQSAEETGWKPASLSYLSRNGFGGIREHVKSLAYTSHARAMIYKKRTGKTQNVLFFYKIRIHGKPQIRCEIYTHDRQRGKLYKALASRMDSRPYKQFKTLNSHLVDWKLNNRDKNVQVRYFYKLQKEKFFDFKGTLLWTYAKA